MHTNPRRALQRSLFFAAGVVGIVLGVASCKPDYPTCETDDDCKEKKEFCVNRKCVQCRDGRDCKTGFACTAGRCTAISGYCQDRSQCAPGQECIANRCRACESDAECPSGLKCMRGQCTKPQCTKDEDCAQDQDCTNGQCVGSTKPAAGPPCPLEPVYFGFNESALTSDGTSALNKNAECLKKAAGRQVNLVGRADPRGTTEYNLALSDRRAQSVKEYLQRLGVEAARLRSVPRGALDATGTDEAGWAKDRRVDAEWQ
jgi:peptidoglycan-associated lipoprotein